MRGVAIHSLRFVDNRQLVALDLRHQIDLGFLHRDLVLVDLALALAGEVPAGSHRQRIGDQSRQASNCNRLVLIDRRRADHAGHQTEVGSESVVETIHDVAQKSARRRLVPGLGALAGDLAKGSRMVR